MTSVLEVVPTRSWGGASTHGVFAHSPVAPVRHGAHDPGGRLAEDEDSRLMRSYLSRQWAEDWDCPEDAVYDSW